MKTPENNFRSFLFNFYFSKLGKVILMVKIYFCNEINGTICNKDHRQKKNTGNR